MIEYIIVAIISALVGASVGAIIVRSVALENIKEVADQAADLLVFLHTRNKSFYATLTKIAEERREDSWVLAHNALQEAKRL